MANSILAAQPLLRNDIEVLTELFEASFDYFIENNSPFFEDYLQALRTLVGLGFAATLASRGLLCVYKPYLERFLNAEEGDFRKSPSNKTWIAQSVAQMVASATVSFYCLKASRYYDDFVEALCYTIVRISNSAAQRKEGERILGYLSKERWW